MASHLNVQGIFAAATVSDLSTALMWYECFLGRPADDHPGAMAQFERDGGPPALGRQDAGGKRGDDDRRPRSRRRNTAIVGARHRAR